MFGRNKYSDGYEDAREDDEPQENVYGQKPVVLPDRFAFGDLLLALLLGVGAFALLAVFALPWLYPSAWGDLAVGAGLRPAEKLFPGVWRLLASLVYSGCGARVANFAMPIVSKAVVATGVFLMYFVFRGLIAVTVRLRGENRIWSRFLARLVSAIGAVAFLCADPVWRAAQTFSPVTLLLFLTVFTLAFLIRFLQTGRLPPAYVAMFALGGLCAETPFGFFLLGGFWLGYHVLLSKGRIAYMEILQPFTRQVSKWYLTFVWFAGFFAAVTANVLGYMGMEGLEANGLLLGDLPLAYITHMWHVFTEAASAGGWIIGLGVVAMPLLLALTLVTRSTDEEYFLPYHLGVIFILAGLLEYSQLASLSPLWFWTWIKHPAMVPSEFFQCVFSMMSALTLVLSLAVLAVDGYCRNHRRLAMQYDPEAAFDAEEVPTRFVMFTRRVSLVLIPLLLVAGLLPGRFQFRTGRMLEIVRDYVREAVRELGDAKYVFTDGSCDCAFELEAAARGKKLRALSMIGKPSARDTWMRQQSLQDNEDRLSAYVGTANLLRTWQRDKPQRLDDAAMQLGFELWKRSGKTPPAPSGVLARTKGMSDKDREDGITRTYSISERVLQLYADGGTDQSAGPFVNDIFLFVQWRLARMARARAEGFDLVGDTKRSLEEIRVSDALDDKNESLKRILDGMSRMREQTMRQMTPREGLQFALVRADFVLARRYAEPILDADPDDPNANFGMGMSYFMQEQFGRAEEFLRRCLKKNAKEPAIWNNIAVLQLKQGRLEEAKKNAQKALDLIPDSAEVKDTMKQIEKAMADRAKKGAVPAATNGAPAAVSAPGKN